MKRSAKAKNKTIGMPHEPEMIEKNKEEYDTDDQFQQKKKKEVLQGFAGKIKVLHLFYKVLHPVLHGFTVKNFLLKNFKFWFVRYRTKCWVFLTTIV